jgi:hypothetical protein
VVVVVCFVLYCIVIRGTHVCVQKYQCKTRSIEPITAAVIVVNERCLQSNLSPCCGLMRGSSPLFPYPFPVSLPSILCIHPLLNAERGRGGQVTGINKSRHKQRKAKADTSNATHKPRAPSKKVRVKAGQGKG